MQAGQPFIICHIWELGLYTFHHVNSLLSQLHACCTLHYRGVRWPSWNGNGLLLPSCLMPWWRPWLQLLSIQLILEGFSAIRELCRFPYSRIDKPLIAGQGALNILLYHLRQQSAGNPIEIP